MAVEAAVAASQSDDKIADIIPVPALPEPTQTPQDYVGSIKDQAKSDIAEFKEDVVEPTKDALRAFDDNVVSRAGRAIEDAAGDFNDQQIGPNNPLSMIARESGSDTAARVFAAPSWKEWGKPGEAFYNEFNDGTYVLPEETRQYAAPVVGAVLNFVPGVGPLLSAGFNTAYNAGAMQANQKGMDWGEVGKDALTNFGTAAISMAASKALQGAKSTQALNASRAQTEASLGLSKVAAPQMSTGFNAIYSGGANAPQTGSWLGQNALRSFDNAARMGQVSLAASSPLTAPTLNSGFNTTYKGGTNAPKTGSSLGASAAAKIGSSPLNTSLDALRASSMMPEGGMRGGLTYANSAGGIGTNAPYSTGDKALQPSFLDKVYNSAVDSMAPGTVGSNQLKGVGMAALANTLAPKQNTALSGFSDGTSVDTSAAEAPGYQQGDAFNAFYTGGGEFNQDTYDQGLSGLRSNMGLQLGSVRDTHVPVGQDLPDTNTPYGTRVTDIFSSGAKAAEDYTQSFNDASNAKQKAEYDRQLAAYNAAEKTRKDQYDQQMAQYDAEQAQYDGWQSDYEQQKSQYDAEQSQMLADYNKQLSEFNTSEAARKAEYDTAQAARKASVDSTNQFNQQAYAGYNKSLFDALSTANPGRITQSVFDGWNADPKTAPDVFSGLFKPAPTPLTWQ